jgi:hypothetical protein
VAKGRKDGRLLELARALMWFLVSCVVIFIVIVLLLASTRGQDADGRRKDAD